jgi:hypothetical protein
VYQNELDFDAYDLNNVKITNLECIGELGYYIISSENKNGSNTEFQKVYVSVKDYLDLNKSFVKIYTD